MTLEDLIVKKEIEDLLYIYCRAMDRVDDDLALSVWHEDGTLQYFDRPVQTIRQFLAYSSPARLTLKSHTHAIVNILTKVDGDMAYSESYGISLGQQVPNDGVVIDDIYSGRYLDRWSKRDGKWGLEHRKYIPESYAKTQSPEAWSGGRAAGGIIPPIAKRDRTDPSYAFFAGVRLEDGVPRQD